MGAEVKGVYERTQEGEAKRRAAVQAYWERYRKDEAMRMARTRPALERVSAPTPTRKGRGSGNIAKPPSYLPKEKTFEKVGVFTPGVGELTSEQEQEVVEGLSASDKVLEYGMLRDKGYTGRQAVKEMDRVRGLTGRGWISLVREAQELEETLVLHRLSTVSIEEFSESQWRAMESAIMLRIAQHPGPNSSASLAAVKAINSRRFEAKFGTREAVERTKAECERRMKELDEILSRAAGAGTDGSTQGVGISLAEGRSTGYPGGNGTHPAPSLGAEEVG